ncbi:MULTISPECIES: Stealth CR1 domain-containing protein [unclassified Janthinobacterium]|uniref:Stealth CR1 domain-containing protein n=1 Tax=unclassified Janthinobacterium TaxID=2610881 RepID=UPI00087EBBF0|nr:MULTISPECIES: Stealth CR1 domain-containing protein [unclassified Janthinobacterium]SDA65777.1 Stealth protein CR1, conserved region 1 [Janthinobacterium sp. 551a]SFB11596.1 Stealth protein CR1, conserved region 1 [Janthinobacterium sp. 344]
MSGIDIVYLWVDGADPAWRARRRQAYAAWAQAHPGQLALHGNVAGRYRDNGELRYNLRALERFFPGHGHVYLLTDRQVPAWLRASPRLTVIDHASLMPGAALPVFDSGHIESYLHHIPGLSECFLYLNDDVFLGAPFEPAFWFGDGEDRRLSAFTESAPQEALEDLRDDVAAPVNCATLARQWLSAQYADYRHEAHLYAHAPRPMRKSALHALEALAPAMFAGVRATVFRSWRVPALLPDLVPRWMVHQGLARDMVLDPLHIASGDARAPDQLKELAARFGSLPFFCINDTCDEAEDDDPRLLRVAAALQRLLPLPSSFEAV